MNADEIISFKNLMRTLYGIGIKNKNFNFSAPNIKNSDNMSVTHAFKFEWWGGYHLKSTRPPQGISIHHCSWQADGKIICQEIWFYNYSGELTLDIGQYSSSMFEAECNDGLQGFLSPRCRIDSDNLFSSIKMQMLEII